MKDPLASTLDDLIADFLDEAERGHDVSPQQFIAAYPALREPFLRFVAQHMPIDKSAKEDTIAGQTSDLGTMSERPQLPSDYGRRVGRYRLIRALGSGGMSVVYEAIASDSSEPVALKVLHASVASDRGMRQRFQREAETIRSLNHEHIVSLCDFGTHDETSFLAMRMIDGETLAQQIMDCKQRALGQHEAERGDSEPAENETGNETGVDSLATSDAESGRWSMTEMAAAMAKVADALFHAHSRGTIHRDVKPSNLLIDSDRKLWLTDFGLASAGEAQTVVTRTGQVIGTPHYMSPEQASGAIDQIDHRSDIYSLGATLYEWVTLHRPYQGDRFRVLLEISSGRLRPPSQVCENIPPPLEAIILKAMSLSPADRYASAAEMANDLLRFSLGAHVTARRPGPADLAMRWLARNPRTSIFSTLGFVAVVLLVMLIQYVAGQRLSDVNTQLHSSNQAIEQSNAELAQTNRDLDRSQARLRRHLYVADMASAYRAYAQQDLNAVNSLLQRELPDHAKSNLGQSTSSDLDLRGFEWWLLRNLSRPPEVLTLAGHDGPTTEAVLIPDTKQLLSVGEDGWARHWDLLSGRQLNRWQVGEKLNAVAVSPDGKKWVTSDSVSEGLNPVTLRDRSSGDVIAQLRGHETTVESAAFSPDGKWIATASRYHEVLVHDAKGNFRGRLMTGSRNESLGFSPDGSQLIAVIREEADTDAGTRQRLRSWSLPDLQPAAEWEFEFGPFVFALSANGERIVVADGNNWALYRWADPEPIVVRTEIRGRMRCVAIDSNGSRVAAGCDNGLLYVWEIDGNDHKGEMRPPRVITASDQKITSVTFGEDEKVIASCEDGTLQVWFPNRTKVEHPTFGRSTRAITLRPADTDVLFLRGDNGDIKRLTLSTREEVKIAHVDADEHYKLALSSDGKKLVAAAPGEVVVVSAAEGRELHRIDHDLDEKACRELLFVDDDRRLLVLFNDRLREYQTSGWAMTKERFLPGDGAELMRCSPDGSTVLVLSRDTLRWYDTQDLDLIAEYPRQFGLFAWAGYSEDGQTIATGYQDGTIELLNAVTRAPVGLLRGHRDQVSGLKFIDGDRTLISSASDDEIRFWDVGSGREIGVLDAGRTKSEILHFSRPLQQLFSFGPRRPIKVWSGQRFR
ncbi:WD40 repeat domain-containing serine/threonine protein kinase [Novipirellula galeiformis]|uniref:WD40 repeat domain-containing serine/threonine protein kinase n=1 Tax=Novipirellula galeiformis TaxID=2528004 RepID=UPI0018CE86FF|nr:WD40 repeat domain-containing serine/threonine protein kinase [Novipirellula galeiformis]